MTGNRHFAKENERRQRAAIKVVERLRSLDVRYPGTSRIAREYGLSPEDVVRVVARHGEKLAEVFAKNAVATGYTIGAVAALYEAMVPPPSVDELVRRLEAEQEISR
jgi:anaerobic selenocysteine-containing dehydrogenase